MTALLVISYLGIGLLVMAWVDNIFPRTFHNEGRLLVAGALWPLTVVAAVSVALLVKTRKDWW